MLGHAPHHATSRNPQVRAALLEVFRHHEDRFGDRPEGGPPPPTAEAVAKALAP